MNNKPGKRHDAMRRAVLYTAAKSFLEVGYTATTLKDISTKTKINIGSLTNLFKSKEDILCDLVNYVLDGQFVRAQKMVEGKTDDKILFYAAETTLQLYMAESNEHIRELYAAAYSMPKTSAIIQHTITGKLEEIFKEHLPGLQTKDFFELEIASGGIMRGFMTVPCDIYFTMDRKVKRFVETTLLVYRVPQAKIEEALAFISQFDYVKLAQETVAGMMTHLEQKMAEEAAAGAVVVG